MPPMHRSREAIEPKNARQVTRVLQAFWPLTRGVFERWFGGWFRGSRPVDGRCAHAAQIATLIILTARWSAASAIADSRPSSVASGPRIRRIWVCFPEVSYAMRIHPFDPNVFDEPARIRLRSPPEATSRCFWCGELCLEGESFLSRVLDGDMVMIHQLSTDAVIS